MEIMEELSGLVRNLCEIDKEWSSTIQNYIKEDAELQNEEILKAFDDFMNCACEKYKTNPEELEEELDGCLGENAEWIIKLIRNTLYTYIRLREYRQIIDEDEEKGRQLLKYVFDNTIVRYDPDFFMQYKKWGLSSPKQLLKIASIFRGLTGYYIERRLTIRAIKKDLLDETGISDAVCDYYIELYEQNYMTLQLNYIIMQMREVGEKEE